MFQWQYSWRHSWSGLLFLQPWRGQQPSLILTFQDRVIYVVCPLKRLIFFLLTGHKSNVDPTPERKFFIPIPGDTDVGHYIRTEVSYLVCLGLTKLMLL